MTLHNKLVRDKIPQRIRKDGGLVSLVKLVPSEPGHGSRSSLFEGRKPKIFFAETDDDFKRAWWLQIDFIALKRLFGAIFTAPVLETSVEVLGYPALFDQAFFTGLDEVQWFCLYSITEREFLERLASVFGGVELVGAEWVRQEYELEVEDPVGLLRQQPSPA